MYKYKIIGYYCLFFYLLAAYKLLNGMWLFETMPHLFITRFDGVTWTFMQMGIHEWLIDNPAGWISFDIAYYALPLVYLLVYRSNEKYSIIPALLMLAVNWLYVQHYTLYPTNSIEAHTAWLLFPIAFLSNNERTFRLLIEGLRYFFLFCLVSAGIWKIVNGGVFNPDQMSGVLLFQHADLLTNSPGYWQTEMIEWLIANKQIGYALYIAVTILELLFIIGFFTKRCDRVLIILFLVFLVANHLVMRIPYYEWLPWLITLRSLPLPFKVK